MNSSYSISRFCEKKDCRTPTVRDDDLTVKLVTDGLDSPTSMAFLDNNNILVLEKNTGMIKRVVNGVLLHDPLLKLNVVGKDPPDERGLVGIAITKEKNQSTYVFLYYTDSIESEKDSGINRIYRYEFVNNKLIKPKLFFELPKWPSYRHISGVITIGPDNNLYVIVGDHDGYWGKIENKAQNNLTGAEPDGTGGILRFTKDGSAVGKGIIGKNHPLNLYFAYGIRNSFGIDFDPVTGNLWDTENGDGFGDEINLVEPGFNSGWSKVTGMSKNIKNFDISKDLVNFNNKGQYSDPEFVWNETIGPTSIQFLSSDKLGKEYQNDLFVGDVVNGAIYHFDLNEKRTGLILKGQLEDKVAEKRSTGVKDIQFATGFDGVTHGITDIEEGPDGYLYIVSYGHGSIYRIMPKTGTK
jgi:aldose sugar dehydrogenase